MMTGSEAAKVLRDAGFEWRKSDSKGGNHYLFTKDGHSIMISEGSQELDPATRLRVEKLCRGELTSRGIERARQQGKLDSQQRDNFKIGDRIRDINSSRKGEVKSLNYGENIVYVKWDGQDYTSKIPIGCIQIRREHEEPAHLEEAASRKELPMPEGEPEGQQSPKILREAFKDLESIAATEYLELCELQTRIDEYNRMIPIAEQLGVKMEPLPFVVVNGALGPVVEVPGTVEETQPLQPPQETEAPSVPVQVIRERLGQRHRRRSVGLDDKAVLAFLQSKGGRVSKSELYNHWGYYRKAQVTEILDRLISVKRVTVEISREGKQKSVKTVYEAV